MVYTGNDREFEIDLAKSFVGIEEELVDLHKQVGRYAVEMFINRTPKDYGFAKDNWQAAVGQPNDRVIGERKSGDPSGRKALAEAFAVIDTLQPYEVLWLFNNDPKITILEEGGFVPPNPGPSKDPRPRRKGRTLVRGGYSTQAPKGMVQITLDEIERKLAPKQETEL